MSHLRVLLLLATVGLLAAAHASPFENATFDCQFSRNTDAKPEALAMTFSGFDDKKGEALLIGNAGADRVLFVPSEDKALIVQFTATGNGTMTSISRPVAGKSTAFHSRHIWLLGKPVVSHYDAGSCTLRR